MENKLESEKKILKYKIKKPFKYDGQTISGELSFDFDSLRAIDIDMACSAYFEAIQNKKKSIDNLQYNMFPYFDRLFYKFLIAHMLDKRVVFFVNMSAFDYLSLLQMVQTEFLSKMSISNEELLNTIPNKENVLEDSDNQ